MLFALKIDTTTRSYTQFDNNILVKQRLVPIDVDMNDNITHIIQR